MRSGAGSQFGIMTFPDQSRGVREMTRVVKRGGRVLMIVYGSPAEIDFLGFLVSAVHSVRSDFVPPMDPPPPEFRSRIRRSCAANSGAWCWPSAMTCQ